jgi:WD40 repeat protein
LWDMTSLKPIGESFEVSRTVQSIAFSRDGTLLASGHADGTIAIWEVASRKLIINLLKAHSSNVTSLSFGSDNMTLISGGEEGVIRWNLDPSQSYGLPLQYDWILEGENLAFNPEKKNLAVTIEDRIVLWDSTTRMPIQELRPNIGPLSFVAFGPDGKTIVSGARRICGASDFGSGAEVNPDANIVLWDMQTFASRTLHIRGMEGVGFCAPPESDGRFVVQANRFPWGGSVNVWDATNGRLRSELRCQTPSPPDSVTFSPDGTMSVLSCYIRSGISGNDITAWNLAENTPISTTLSIPIKNAFSLAFSRDGKILAFGGENMIILWDWDNQQPIGLPFIGDFGTVTDLAFSPDGTMLASTSSSYLDSVSNITLWDAKTHQRIGLPFQIDPDSAIFSPDSTALAVRECIKLDEDGQACAQGRIVFWDIRLESWIHHACRIANRNMTQVEWNQFIGSNIPYRRTCSEFPLGIGAAKIAP